MTERTSLLTAALEQLRLKLLDLTGRNRLVNFKHTAGRSLQFVQGNPEAIYNKLVEGTGRSAINILGLSEPPRKNWIERNGRLQRPDPREWATVDRVPTSYDIVSGTDGIADANVRALMYPDDLAKHCRKIEREAKLAIEETGANMLFIVLGFLEFPDQRNSDNKFLAPLISIPVSLQKREVAGIQQFSAQYTGDDITENLSLREKLRNDFEIVLPELSEDEIDVEGYFRSIRKVIKHQPEFAIRTRVSLCLLSFSNMLLVRDLDPSKWPSIDDKNALLDHPIVKEVFEGRADAGGAALGIAEEHPVEEGPGTEIPLIYDADSSQHSALVDVLALNRNLVIEGPPGTGKSQTITNLIAACLSKGKKVLFVAEKLAALEVVKNRLTLAGLDPFVLELHSNKTSKKRVLEELEARIKFRPSVSKELPRLQEQMESHRRDLKAYSDLINSVSCNSFGLTLHQIMWRAEKYRQNLKTDETSLTQIAVEDASQVSAVELSRRMELLGYLADQYRATGGFDSNCAFWGFYPKPLVPGDEIRLSAIFKEAETTSENLVHFADALAGALGESIHNVGVQYCEKQIHTLNPLIAAANARLPFELTPTLFADDDSGRAASAALSTFSSRVTRYHELEPSVTCALTDDAKVSNESRAGLQTLQRSADSLGAALATLHDIESLAQRLSDLAESLGAAAAKLETFSQRLQIPFDGSRESLKRLAELTALVSEPPEQHLHLYSPAIGRDGATQAIEALDALQSQWVSLEESLNQSLYLDVLPPESEIREAMLTLREGDAWYRVFQSHWRRAIRLHKRLLRIKQRSPTLDRLIQLEQILKLIDLKRQWQSSTTWRDYLGIQGSEAAVPLDGYLALAKWSHSLKRSLDEIEATLIRPEDFTAERIRLLRREFSANRGDVSSAVSAFGSLHDLLPRLVDFNGGSTISKTIEKSVELKNALSARLPWLRANARSTANFNNVIAGCDAALERHELRNLIESDQNVKNLLSTTYHGVQTNCLDAMEVLRIGQSLDSLDLSPQVKTRLRSAHLLDTAKILVARLADVLGELRSVEAFSNTLSEFGVFDLADWVGDDPNGDIQSFARAFRDSSKKAAASPDLLIPWALYIARRGEAVEASLSVFVELLEERRLDPNELTDAYAYCVYSSITRMAFRKISQLGRFTGLKHNQIREEFQRLDKELISLRGKAVGQQCARTIRIPPGRSGARLDDKTEMVLLNYLIPQQRPRMPVRKMLSRAGSAVQALKPCFMMGPQAVAQYLAPGAVKFDLVIMDEASQLRPEEAIGAIARGGQLVVVGDPKQLPPTSFFSRMTQDGDSGEEQFSTTDAESILDVCSSHFHPTRALRWHYRSQHHSLIAFSNHNFYQGNLVIFPSPYGQGGRLGVRATYLADAVYEQQTNIREAKRVVDAVAEHIATRPGESLGVVTLNIKQRDLIAELLDERLKTAPGADSYRDHWTTAGQPLFIKNLENVQGDERDAIIISTTFGKPQGANAVRQNFGPISRQGGWRRLNVLFTRAKKSIALYTSLRPEDIIVDGATPEGTKALRNYLEYARTGLLPTIQETGRDPDSDFEIAVMDVLKRRGYAVTPQLGVAGYRIDIAVKHPDAPGAYLAAIECDGASYHSALSVRDRDRIRQEILEALGWRGRIWRIWSTDWFRTPRQETEKLLGFLDDLRRNWRPEHTSSDAWIEEGQAPNATVDDSQFRPAVGDVPTLSETDRKTVSAALIDTGEDLEVEVGDLVRYLDKARPDDVLSVQITKGKDDFTNGIVNESRPLAQALLGAVIGDEVALHLVGQPPKKLLVIEIRRLKSDI
jgi:transcription elongation GreA/GreB family factor